jgi:hypothetical protein
MSLILKQIEASNIAQSLATLRASLGVSPVAQISASPVAPQISASPVAPQASASTHVVSSEALDYQARFQAAISARKAYEANKNASNDSIQNTLTQFARGTNHASVASMLMLCNVQVECVNSSTRVDSRFNVYTLDKVSNIARFLAQVEKLNHFTLHIFASIVACDKASVSFNADDARACCSRDIKVTQGKPISQLQQIKSTGTVQSQHSSSLAALLACDAISESRDSSGKRCFTRKLTKASEALEARLSA